MSSKWSSQRREKRKVSSYLEEESQSTEGGAKRKDSSYLEEETHSTEGGVCQEICQAKEIVCEESDIVEASNDPHGSTTTTCNIFPEEYIFLSDSSDSDVETDPAPPAAASDSVSVEDRLRHWATNHNVTHAALKDLLGILKAQYDPHLPSDPRTLCKTPSDTSRKIIHISDGEYFHFGLLKCVHDFLENIPEINLKKVTKISMRINCDGIPLFRSSNKQLWPILVQFCTDYDPCSFSSPVPVGIYLGNSKPGKVEDYLSEFMNEIKSVKDGYDFKGTKYEISIECFICDAPARQYLKCIKSHTGYSSCERCQQIGKYDETVIFPEINAPLRTDASFISMADSDHHKGESPLHQIGVGLVSQFVLDPMHLVYLGVMRKLLYLWLKGPLPTRVGTHAKDNISRKLQEMSVYMPLEFNRKPRSLNELDRYKATEFRSFLLYTGPVCLLKNINENIYKNFLLLSVSIRLLSSDLTSHSIKLADEYLTAFLKHFEALYGQRHLVYNVHNLHHITTDVKNYGSLDSFSSFPFENYLGTLKKLLRKPNCILSQIVNRIHEQKYSKSQAKKLTYPYTASQHSKGPVLRHKLDETCHQFKTLHLEKFCIRTSSADNAIMINNCIGKVVNILKYENDSDVYVLYHVYEHYEDLFTYPTRSKDLEIYLVANESNVLSVSSYKDIKQKYVLFPYGKKLAALPLIHSGFPQ